MAIAAKEAEKYVGRSATTWRHNEDEEMMELRERKSDFLHDMVDYYEKEAAKVSNQLYKITSSSDAALEVPII